MQIFRNKSPYYRTLLVLSAARIAIFVLPVFVLVFFLWRLESQYLLEALSFAALLVVIIATYAILSRRYRILLSGHNGERALSKIIKNIRWEGECAVFTNMPVAFGNSHSEIDMLIVGERGVVIIEVKNHSGVILGNESDDFWYQKKKFREGKSIEKKMVNPLIQLKRQRSLIKDILQERGEDVWIENLLFFSNPNVKLKITTGEKYRVFSSKDELVNYINRLEPVTRLSKEDCVKITGIIRNMTKSI